MVLKSGMKCNRTSHTSILSGGKRVVDFSAYVFHMEIKNVVLQNIILRTELLQMHLLVLKRICKL